MNCQKIFLGTELKLKITMEPIDGYNLEDCDFYCLVYCVEGSKKHIILNKGDSRVKQVDENSYVLLVDSCKLGAGTIKIKVVVNIPDADFSSPGDGFRREVTVVNTNISIRNENSI